MKLLAGVLILVLAGCGIVEEREARERALNDPNLTADIRTAIEAQKIKKGMTQDQVIASWGKPCWYCYGTRSTSEGEWWEYNPFGTGRYSVGNGTYLFFGKDGKLQYWSD